MAKQLYTSEELDLFSSLEKSLETGKHTPISDASLTLKKKQLSHIAKNTIRERTKKKTINIRIAEHDLSRIKSLSLEE